MLKRKQNEELTFSKFDTDNTGFSHLIWGLAFKQLFQMLVVLATRRMCYVPLPTKNLLRYLISVSYFIIACQHVTQYALL